MTASKSPRFMSIIGVGLVVLGLAGCATSGTQPPPSAVEQLAFATTTNYVTVTNYVSATNWVTQVNTITNTNNQVVTVTNLVAQPYLEPVVTNVPNYTFTPNATAQAVAGGAATVGNIFVPGWGSLISAGLMALLGAYGTYRTNQAKNTAQQVAQNSVEAINVAQSIIGAIPGTGPQLLAQFQAWMAQHQADADLAVEVAKYVDQITHTADAAHQGVATQIVQAVVSAGTPATQPASPASPVKTS